MPVLRLDKFITAMGLASRNESRELIRRARVWLNGQPARPESRVDTDKDAVTLDGETVEYIQYATYMMNKPAGVISATEDDRERTVLDLLDDAARRRGVAPAGRLDKDAEGLLLITDDGTLAHRVISPSHGIIKTYEAVIESPPAPGAEKQFADGLTLGDGTVCLPAKLERLSEDRVRVYVSEGRYHQVKRMLANVGSPVLKLRRLAIGALKLDESLAPGEYRRLTEREIGLLFLSKENDL